MNARLRHSAVGGLASAQLSARANRQFPAAVRRV
jgi:hypothetical protein